MNNLAISSQSSQPNFFKSQRVTSVIKLIVFEIGELNLALPIESVYKVVDRVRIYSSGINSVGVAHIGDSLRDSSASPEVTVIDLYCRLFKSNHKTELDRGGYLVIVQTTTGELYGIPVANTPVLMEVSLSMIRLLPESYRRADTLEFASHVAVIPRAAEPLTIFLLDVDLLLSIL